MGRGVTGIHFVLLVLTLHRLPSCLAATNVVLLPTNGSRIKSPPAFGDRLFDQACPFGERT